MGTSPTATAANLKVDEHPDPFRTKWVGPGQHQQGKDEDQLDDGAEEQDLGWKRRKGRTVRTTYM